MKTSLRRFTAFALSPIGTTLLLLVVIPVAMIAGGHAGFTSMGVFSHLLGTGTPGPQTDAFLASLIITLACVIIFQRITSRWMG